MKGLTFLFAFFLSLIFSMNASAQLNTWGYNAVGQLGNGTNLDQPMPMSIGQPNITAVSANYTHTIALLADGTLLAWGQNGDGEIGDGSTTRRFSPVPVQNLEKVIAIAAGVRHSVALKADRTVWIWGRNWEGQLGQGTSDTGIHPLPVQVPGLTNVIAISAHYLHTLALKSDGTVWAWGNNLSGQLGYSQITNSVPAPVQVQNLSNVIQIAAGHDHSVALKSDGTVWVWGYNGNGEYGNNTSSQSGCQCQVTPVQASISGVTQITAGINNTAALKPNGEVFVWGKNEYGQLGNNTTGGNALLPVQSPISNVVELKMRGYHMLARLRDGTVKAWGRNFEGQLGNGTTNTTGCLCNPSIVTSQVGSGNALIAAGNFSSFSAKPVIPTNPGMNIFFPGENVRLTFDGVTGAGATGYTAIDPSTNPLVTGAIVPAGYVIQNNQPAYNVVTTAGTSGDIDVCLNVTGEYDPTAFAYLKILHREDSALVDRTSSSNLRRRQICARVTSLSPFVVAQGLAPTAFSVSGRVFLRKGRFASHAIVSLTDSQGNTRIIPINPFGYYKFINVLANESYTLQVLAKGYSFAPQIVALNETVEDLNFTAQ